MSTDASERVEFGENLRRRREAAGMTREVLASLAGCSVEALKKWERGERGAPRTQLLAKLTMALGMTDIRELIGGRVGMPVASGLVVIPAVADIKMTVRTAVRAPLPARPPEPLELDQRADAGWRLWHASPYQRTQVGELLPQLILDVHAASRMAEDLAGRRRAAAAMTQVYALTMLAIGYVCEADLYWTVLDRVQMAAHDADRPHALGLAAWCQGVALRYSADPHEGVTSMTDSLGELAPHAADDDHEMQALIGSLHLATGVALAQDGVAGDAWRHWDKADAIAGALPAGYWHKATVFSRSNVEVNGVAMDASLRKLGDALSRADQIDPEAIPSTERATRLRIDAATAYHHRGEDQAAVYQLQEALRRGPENTRIVPAARSLVMDLRSTRPPSLARAVDELAEKMDLAPV